MKMHEEDEMQSERSCIRCTKPANVERRMMGYSEYIDATGEYCIAEKRGPVESVIYLCYSCAERELVIQ
jgi:hypothetical protein